MPFGDRSKEAGLFVTATALAVFGYGWFENASDGFNPGLKEAEALRVVTWNVGGKAEVATDPDSYAVGHGQPLSGEWLAHVATTLGELDPDLVFLQEVRNGAQLWWLRRALGPSWDSIITAYGNRRVAVLAQRGRLKRSFGARHDRPNVLAVTFHPDHHPAIFAVVLHADAFDARRRNRDIGDAVDSVMQGHDGGARLLAGDLNLDLDLDKRRDLFSNDEYLDVESYNYITPKLFDVGIGRGSTAEPDRRIDYIFINSRLAVIDAGSWKDHRINAMDHDPLVADLIFADR